MTSKQRQSKAKLGSVPNIKKKRHLKKKKRVASLKDIVDSFDESDSDSLEAVKDAEVYFSSSGSSSVMGGSATSSSDEDSGTESSDAESSNAEDSNAESSNAEGSDEDDDEIPVAPADNLEIVDRPGVYVAAEDEADDEASDGENDDEASDGENDDEASDDENYDDPLESSDSEHGESDIDLFMSDLELEEEEPEEEPGEEPEEYDEFDDGAGLSTLSECEESEEYEDFDDGKGLSSSSDESLNSDGDENYTEHCSACTANKVMNNKLKDVELSIYTHIERFIMDSKVLIEPRKDSNEKYMSPYHLLYEIVDILKSYAQDVYKSKNNKSVTNEDINETYEQFIDLLKNIGLDNVISFAKPCEICDRKSKNGGSIKKNNVYNDLSKSIKELANSKTIDRRVSSGIVIPTNDELFGHNMTYGKLSKQLGKYANVSDMYIELGMCNSPRITRDIDGMNCKLSDFLKENDLNNKFINRRTIKKMRPLLTPENYKFMKPRMNMANMNQDEIYKYVTCNNSQDHNKTLQSYILGVLSTVSEQEMANPLLFIKRLKRGIINAGTFSNKHQWIHPKIRDFITIVADDIPFKGGCGIYQHDASGLLRFSDMHKYGAIEYLDDDTIKDLYGMTKEKALAKYGATSDIDLLVKSCRLNNSKFKQIRNKMHKMLDYDDVSRTLSGLTSVTLMNILESLAHHHNDFSYVVYALPEDCHKTDLWLNARECHFIVNSNTYNGTPHWFCMGRFIDSRDRNGDVGVTYFLYCSVNTVPKIFVDHEQSLIKQMKKDINNGFITIGNDKHLDSRLNIKPNGISLRIPTVQSQFDGNACGLFVAGVATSLANKKHKEFYNYLTHFKSEKELLKLVGKYLVPAY